MEESRKDPPSRRVDLTQHPRIRRSRGRTVGITANYSVGRNGGSVTDRRKRGRLCLSSQPKGRRNIEYSSALFLKEAVVILRPGDQNKSTLRGGIPLPLFNEKVKFTPGMRDKLVCSGAFHFYSQRRSNAILLPSGRCF